VSAKINETKDRICLYIKDTIKVEMSF